MLGVAVMSLTLSDVAVLLHPSDSVAVARRRMAVGETVAWQGGLTIRSPIPMGHNFALCSMLAGEPIYKYGQIIGFATQDISPGEHCHTQNVTCGQYNRDYAIATEIPPPLAAREPARFKDFLDRMGGSARGTISPWSAP